MNRNKQRNPGWRAWALAVPLLIVSGCSRPGTAENLPSGAMAPDLRALAGAHARVVWCQQVAGDGADTYALGGGLALMGYDTDDGRGERQLLPAVTNYHKPLLTPDGARVVFSDHFAKTISVVNWDGSGLRSLAPGMASSVWQDPNTGMVWVYGIAGDVTVPAFLGQPVFRFRLDDPAVREIVWSATEASLDNFMVSADGRMASSLFPWPAAGLADLANGKWTRTGKGCWTGMAPDNSYWMWIFDGSHRNLLLVDSGRGKKWAVNLSQAPGVDGFEVYHPRWSNRKSCLVMSGPYKGGGGNNRIGAGGPGVEIYAGRFNADYTAVEAWFQVSRNSQPDFFPDLWVAGDAGLAIPSAEPQAVEVPRNPPAPLATPAADGPGLVVRGVVTAKSETPSPASIAPYRAALIVDTYAVREVVQGNLTGDRILVARWGIYDAAVLPDPAAMGQENTLTLELYDDHPELEGERLVMDSEEFDLPLFYDVQSVPAVAMPAPTPTRLPQTL